MSILGFVERLHWMLRTAPSFYEDSHEDEPTAQALIKGFLTALFGEDTWNIDQPLMPWVGVPRWVEHPWRFYDVVPDFLHSSEYWNFEAETPEDIRPYFDGGDSDSCTFFFKDTVFYFFLTNGSP